MTVDVASLPAFRQEEHLWLIEAEFAGGNGAGWTRLAVRAPTPPAASLRATEAFGGELTICRIYRDDEMTLDEEAELLSRVTPADPVAWAPPLWPATRDAILSPALVIKTAPPPADDVRGFEVLPASLRRAPEPDRIYAVLDGAAIFSLPELLSGSGLAWKCLFQGKAAESYANAAPYLIELRPDNALSRKLLRPLGTDRMPGGQSALSCGVFLSSPVSLEGLWRHLRKFTMLLDPATGKRAFFRFYDPLIFRTLVVNLAAENLNAFCSGIRSIAAVDARGGFAVVTRERVQT